MKTPTSKKYLNFVQLLERFRPWMEAERLTMSETDFLKKYSTSRKTVNDLMWPCPAKELWWRKYSINFDVEETNKLRLTMSDAEIWAQLHISSSSVGKRCWKRSDLWLPYIYYRTGKKSRENIKPEKKEWLKTDRWETPEISEYELSWMKDAISIGTNPCQSLYDKIL
jgi:hypothetical protein